MMLCFAIIMTRDGMQEVLRYALVFSVPLPAYNIVPKVSREQSNTPLYIQI